MTRSLTILTLYRTALACAFLSVLLVPTVVAGGASRPDAVTAASAGAPRMGIAMAGNGQAEVTFLPPLDTGGAAITGYTITATPVRGASTVVVTSLCTHPLPSGTDQSPNPVRGPAGTLLCTVTGLSNGTVYQLSIVVGNADGVGATASARSNPVTPAVTTVPALDPTVMYVLPTWGGLVSGSGTIGGAATSVTMLQMAEKLRTEIGEGPKARIGLSAFVQLTMPIWPSGDGPFVVTDAMLASAIAPVDAAIANALAVKTATGITLPIGISLITAIRERVDGVETGAQLEDRRNVQWYQDWVAPAAGNGVATGWMTYSAYARKMMRVKEAYVRAYGRLLAQRMAANPEILVAVTGDGEIEMTSERYNHNGTTTPDAQRAWADYSPFAVLEFRDWLRGTGLYAAGQPLAGLAYSQAPRYAGAGGLTQLNADFATAFTTWDLRYYPWALTDPETAGAVTGALSAVATPGGFDAPRPTDRTNILTNTHAFWLVYRQFRNEMVHRYNRDFARWVTEGTAQTDAAVGGVPYDRWYSAQIPTDVLFGSLTPDGTVRPGDFGVRLLTSGSPYWSADIAPYGGMGVTGYNSNGGGAGVAGNNSGFYDRTVVHVVPLVAARGQRWGIIEWNPADPWSPCPHIYRADNETVRRYRPSLLMPYKIDTDRQRVFDSPFTPILKELMTGQAAGEFPGCSVSQPGLPTVAPTSPGVAQIGAWLTSVTWDTPGAIFHPTPLSSTQLNARATVPGTFAYNIRTGTTTSAVTAGTTTPVVGTHTLMAVFEPTDPDYATVTTEVTLTVLDRPTVTVTPTNTRRFAATESLADGARTALSALTPAQAVTVTFSSMGTTGWTATADQPWVLLTPVDEKAGAVQGPGSGQFAIGIHAADVPGGASHAASVRVTAGNSHCPTGHADCTQIGDAAVYTIPVALTLRSEVENQVPEGQVDTPANHAVGLVGAIGVTGWVVDDQGVSHVKIYRNCLPFENQGNCQTIFDDNPLRVRPDGTPPSHHVVFIGDAAFLAGARPDVEAVYPHLPFANRGGWGYLMLTSMLPNLDTQQDFGGQGTLRLFVFATDTSGKTTLLGRAVTDDTPTQITMDNAAIGKPFGALDTPQQGETVSGTIPNFGWALTPDRNTTAGDPDDILIPTNGSTMTVFLNAQPSVWPTATALVTYNQCRGSNLNGGGSSFLSAGVFCNDDVSSIFGHSTPQPTFADRVGNPTRFRNLDAGRGPIGSYVIDTTTLGNGLHTIAWSVTDSAGRTEGIGSRFFIVLNSGSRGAAQTLGRGVASASVEALRAAPAQTVGEASSLETLARGVAQGVQGRSGFTIGAAWKSLVPDAQGTYRVRLPEVGRFELMFDRPVDAGYLSANGTLRPLPIGSSLTGTWFGWMPPTGYFGTYDLVFARDGERIDVTVTVAPPATIDPNVAQIRMHLDAARLRQGYGAATTLIDVVGWAYDPQAVLGSGIGHVHVWARRLDAVGLQAGQIAGPQPAVFVGAAALNVARPDVAQAHTGAPVDSGFTLTASLTPGTYELTAYAWNERTGRWEDARSVVTIVR